MTDPGGPYAALVSLLERELELVRARRFDALAELHEAQAALRAGLTGDAPAPSVRPLLERAQQLQRAIEQELLSTRDSVLDELRRVRHGQRAAQGYKPVRAVASRVTARA